MNSLFLILGFLIPHRPDAALPGQVIDINGGKYFFQAPATVRPGLTTIRFRSLDTGHQLNLYRLEGGHTVADLVRAFSAKEPTPWAVELGGPGFPPPGGSANASYILEPGGYAILCSVHDTKDGTSHYQKGMYGEFTAAGRRVKGALPKADIVVTEIDNAWKFSRPITAGRQVLRVTNAGRNYHELKILRVLPGFTGARALAWHRGLPRADEQFATVTTMAPGVSVITTIDFTAGEYVLFCIPQITNGMKQAITVRARAEKTAR
jgi:plastocyanin